MKVSSLSDSLCNKELTYCVCVNVKPGVKEGASKESSLLVIIIVSLLTYIILTSIVLLNCSQYHCTEQLAGKSI